MGDGGNLSAMRLERCFGGSPRGGRHGLDRHHMAITTGEDILHGALEDEFTAVHDGDAVADLLDLPEKVRTEDDGLSLIAHGMDHPADGG